ncbi:hypothetical protein CsatA_001346 [Cannabis sativa]
MQGNKQFEWTEECEKAFQELKAQLAKPSVLSKPLDGEELGIYLAVTEHAFDSQSFTDVCVNHGIIKSFSPVEHPQANGQVEAVNKTLKDTLKKRLEDAKGNWPEKLPKVLWSYRTTEKTATGETPFAMAYGYEAMLPVELKPPFHRRSTYNQDTNHVLLAESLDKKSKRSEPQQT